jgi:hypothetical protein
VRRQPARLFGLSIGLLFPLLIVYQFSAGARKGTVPAREDFFTAP